MRSSFARQSVPSLCLRLRHIAGSRTNSLGLLRILVVVAALISPSGCTDLSNAVQMRWMKYRLDAAAKVAAAACSETWRADMLAQVDAAVTPSAFVAARNTVRLNAQAKGQAVFLADAGTLGPTLLSGSPTISALDLPGAKGGPGIACNVGYQATLSDLAAIIVSGTATAQVELPPFTQVYLVLDTSQSMMVGASPADEAKVAAWVAANSPGMNTFASLPCAFACHDPVGRPLSVGDLQQGLTVAHSPEVGATTRFDRMLQALINDPGRRSFCGGDEQIACDAGQIPGLLAHIRDKYSDAKSSVDLGTFRYNMFGFNEGINGDEPAASVLMQDVPDRSQYAVIDQTDLATIAAGVNKLTIGPSTHLNPPVKGVDPQGRPHIAVMPALVDLVGQTRADAGSSPDNPFKFLIIVTDGLSSDIDWDWDGYFPTPDAPSAPNLPTRDHPPIGIPPSGMLHPEPIPPAVYCALWSGPPPTVRGAPIWQGTGKQTGNVGECNNDAYSPGFLNSPEPNFLPYNGHNDVFYAQPLDPNYCATLKDNAGHPGAGVTIAVLETPYIPLTGQAPGAAPYENGVQRIIYPDGNPATHPGSESAVTKALRSCASSPALYFQAPDDASIANGLIALFDAFVMEHVPSAR